MGENEWNMVVLVVYIPREHYHVNGSYCTVKTLLLQMRAAGPPGGREGEREAS